MQNERCPHCGEDGFVAGKLPKEVVAIMACQHCDELSVLFRKKIIPLNRRIIESGTFDERKEHLADVIAQFLEAGLLSFDSKSAGSDGAAYELSDMLRARPRKRRPRKAKKDADERPITDQEMDRFVRIDLKCIDNPTYFKRIFG